MTTEEQKKSELVHLKKALNLLGITDYSIIDKDNESPDFLIEIAGNKIGVEVTCLFRDLGNGNSAKVQADLPKIAEESVEIYNTKNGIPLIFAFGINGKVAPSNSRKVVAWNLACFLYEYTNKNFQRGVDQNQDIKLEKADKERFPFLNFVMVQATDKSKSFGFVVSGFNTVSVVESRLEETLRKKEVLIPKYRERCSKIWLLVTLPSMKLAADYTLQDGRSIEMPNQFDAVYVLDEYRDKIQIIKR